MIDDMRPADWPEVSRIFSEGIATGHATFATAPPADWDAWAASKVEGCSLVVRARDGGLAGWAALSPYSSRWVYRGVAEVSIYIAESARGQGVGHRLLAALVARSEARELWTLQAGIFPENTASIRLHERQGFRLLGRYERLGRMESGPLAGQWRDVVMLQRRSAVTGIG